MELFALKAFLSILVSVRALRSFMPTGERAFHPEEVNTVFPKNLKPLLKPQS